MSSFDLSEIERRMRGAFAVLKQEFSGLRTGRASASLLDPIMDAYDRQPGLANLLLDDALGAQVGAAEAALRSAVQAAQGMGIPVPAMAASLAYFDSYRSAGLPQNLTQAQRDAFGAHTYERADAPEEGAIHTDWLKLARKEAETYG